MKIAMFADSYKPQINGMVTSIELFVDDLRRRGHEVHIFAPESPNSKKEKFVYRFESISFRAYREYKIGLPYKMLMDPKFKKINFDIVHVHSPFSLGLGGLAFARYCKLPVVGSFHTMFPDYIHYFIESDRLQKIKLVRHLFSVGSWKYLSWFYNQCNAVIAPSENVKKILIKNDIKKKIIVIPTGIKINKKRQLPKKILRKKYGFGSEKIILHVGRITKEKNIKFIIKALSKMLKNENIKFIIASDGPYKYELEGYAEKSGLSSNVIFAGYLSDEKLSDFYKLSDIFVMASLSETQGLVLTEASINKLPTVVLDAPVISDFVRQNGIGIVSDTKNFSKNVEFLLNNKKLMYRYTKNAEKIKKRYDIRKCTDELLRAYKETI